MGEGGAGEWMDHGDNGEDVMGMRGLGKWVEVGAGDSPRGVRGGSGDRAPERGVRLPSGGISCVRPLVLA